MVTFYYKHCKPVTYCINVELDPFSCFCPFHCFKCLLVVTSCCRRWRFENRLYICFLKPAQALRLFKDIWKGTGSSTSMRATGQSKSGQEGDLQVHRWACVHQTKGFIPEVRHLAEFTWACVLVWFPEVKVFGLQECSEWILVIPPASPPEPRSCY